MSEAVVKIIPLLNISEKRVFSRLGLNRNGSISEQISKEYQPYISRLIRESSIRIFYKTIFLEVVASKIIMNEYEFKSSLVAGNFTLAKSAVMLGASVLPEDFARMESYKKRQDFKSVVILDAIFSEKVDLALDFIENEINIELRRKGQVLGKRLSCGYGDFSLAHQRFFYDELQFEKYGITIDQNNFLLPEKTATGLLPIFEA